MPARTGQEYITGLRDRPREVWLNGERVKDVTTHPALRNGVRSVAALYDMQHDPALRDHRRPGAAAGDDDPLGLGKLRHDGALAGLHELHLFRLGRVGGLLRPEPP